MRTGANRKHTFCESHLQIFVNRCEPVENILCEPVCAGMENYVNRCEPWFALAESLPGGLYRYFLRHSSRNKAAAAATKCQPPPEPTIKHMQRPGATGSDQERPGATGSDQDHIAKH
jgi:hypothetical protein